MSNTTKKFVSMMVFTFIFVVISFSQTVTYLKIGYVNFEKTVESYYKWKDLEVSYQIDLNYYQGKINEMEQQFSDLQSSGASPEVLQQNLQQLQTRVNQYQQALQDEYQQKMANIASEVTIKISQYAKENGYDLILNEIGVVYYNPELDLTDKIIEYLNENKN
ncbi:OmpH family outer membrane protein [Petrotoga sibirica]|uniref:Periplasmic chaperone for outer membrane proteins Skp n=2 Tax=Petrotoga sibirica TaxID=156202 RepID=A0A4R8ERB2_9BACT|nr:OmpH family outer membrane protein [Petrotoga sibirica]POZ88593.1 outer membrane chaperone Skp [Petrotoga sibirica DSM 13575]TDX14954.1 periplasmic chaperone for outer membrane proteins Skp [Petrotoga sibirica]